MTQMSTQLEKPSYQVVGNLRVTGIILGVIGTICGDNRTGSTQEKMKTG